MKVVVVGGGSWGTAFAALLRDRGQDVTLACRDPEQVRAIEETGHNPRYLTTADLRGVKVATVEDAPVAETELVVPGGAEPLPSPRLRKPFPATRRS